MENCEQDQDAWDIKQVHIDCILTELAKDGHYEKDEPIGIYIFGTGNGGAALQRYLQAHSVFNGRQFVVKGYFDNDKSKQGTNIDGLIVCAPHVQLVGKQDYVFVASLSYSYEMERQLRESGLDEGRIIPPGDYLSGLLLQQTENEPLSINYKKHHFHNMLADLGLMIGKNKETGIFIFGTGQGGQTLFRDFIEYGNSQHRRFKIKAFLDNDTLKQGTYYEGISIIAPGKVTMSENDVIIIASDKYYDEMQEQLMDIGVCEEKIILPGKWLNEILGNWETETELIYVNCEKPNLELYNQFIKENNQLVFAREEQPLVSIIIPVHNQYEYTQACLLAISENTHDVKYEVIVADDLSTDHTINISQYAANIRVIRNETNLGFLRNCNHAAQHALGEYIVFLNNDTNVQPGWLSALVHLIKRDEKIGMVGSKLVYPDGRLQEAGGIIWSDASGWNYGRLDNPEKPAYNYVKEVDYISGAAIMIKTDLWREIGGFDERFSPAYFEDADLAFEVRRRGYKVMYQPQSVVVHFEGVSHGTNIATGIKRYQVENRAKFLEKWNHVLVTEQQESTNRSFWARDRSYGKKTLLVIDHHIPYYDHDAGGRTTYHYLKLFVELGLHVIFVGDHYKREPYTSELEQMGIEILYGPWYKEKFANWIREHGKYLDYVYLNRPYVAVKYIDDIKSFTNAKVIYYGHDLHYLREYRQYELEKKNELLDASIRSKKLEFDLFGKVDVIHVVSSYEKEVLEKEIKNKPIRHIPGYLLCDSEHDVQFTVKRFEETRDIMFVGGFNHKPNIDAIVWFVQEIFPGIREKIPEIKLYVIGSNPPYSIKKMKSENIIVTGYVSDEELRHYYQITRLVIAPLRYGAGVKGKIVEAIFNMTPVITTSIGAEGVPGLENKVAIANNPELFAAAVCRLYQNKKQWNSQAEEALHFISKNFSKKVAEQILLLDIDIS